MKRKTIEAVINAKFRQFCESITDARTRELVQQNTIITGGCIASMFLGSKPNDYDLYFRDLQTTLAVAHYYVNKFNEAKGYTGGNEKTDIPKVENNDGRVRVHIQSRGMASETENERDYQYFEGNVDPRAAEMQEYVDAALRAAEAETKGEDYRPIFLTANAITLSADVQCVLRFYGEPDKIHENYDFVHCTNHWDSATGMVTTRPEAMEALLTKELRYVGSKYPLCSVIRTRKFIGRGWTINAGQYLKMCFQISELDLSNPEILEEQLIGVDAAYFAEVVTKLKEYVAQGKQIDATYLCAIVDRIF